MDLQYVKQNGRDKEQRFIGNFIAWTYILRLSPVFYLFMVYFTMLSFMQKIRFLMLGWLLYYEMKWQWCNFRYYSNTCVERLKETTKMEDRTAGNRDGIWIWNLQNTKHNFSFLPKSDLFYLIIVGAGGYFHTWSHSMTHTRYDSSGPVIRPSQRPLTEQHTRLIIDKYPCPWEDLNPQFQKVSDRMPAP